MMKMFKNFFKSLLNFSLYFVGFSVIVWFLWSKLIRERMPKNIPFELTEEKFYILLYICLIYIFIIYFIIFPREGSPFSKIFIKYLYMPITKLDTMLKTNKYCLEKSMNLLNKLHEFSDPIKTNLFFAKKIFIVLFYISFYILPRIILITVLLLDIFYFKKIENNKNFLLLGLFPLTNRYLKYSLKNVGEIYKIYLTKRWEYVDIFGDVTLLTYNQNNFSSYSEYTTYVKAEYEWEGRRLSIEEFVDLYLDNKLVNYITLPKINEIFFYNLLKNKIFTEFYEEQCMYLKKNLLLFESVEEIKELPFTETFIEILNIYMDQNINPFSQI